MDSILRDLKYAFRTLRKSPGFSLFAVATIALGIGATSTIFSVVNAVLLSPLPYAAPERIVAVYENQLSEGNLEFPVAPANYLDWRQQNQVFERMGASRNASLSLTGSGEPERLFGASVTADYFGVLGVSPQIGTGFTASDDVAGGERRVILSDALWRRRFGGDPSIIGKAIQLNLLPYTVVGVMPSTVRLPNADTELWVSMPFGEQEAQARGAHSLNVIARLKPGTTVEQAQGAMRTIGDRIAEQYPNFQSGFNVTVVSLTEDVVGDVRTPLFVLAGAVGFVLLICCANVASLMLARATARRKEIAIRSAIGAGRAHIIRQLLAESLVLSAMGAAGGLLLAAWGVDLLAVLGARELPRLNELSVDGTVIGFTLAVAVVSALLFGLVPAVQASRTDLNETLKDGTKGSSGGPGRNRARQALLVAEVAISLTLLVGAGLMMKSLGRLQSVSPGFRAEGLVTGLVSLPAQKYDTSTKRIAFFEQLEQELKATPGAQTVGFVSGLPLAGGTNIWGYWIEGVTPRNDNSQVPAATNYQVAGDYFGAMGIPLRQGRLLSATDRAESPLVAVVNETLVKQHFKGENPIGKRIQFGPDSSPFVEIVGIVGDVRHDGLGEAAPPQMYVPYAQVALGGLYAVVRTAGDPGAFAPSLRRAVTRVDGDLPVARLRTMDTVIAEGVARPRFLAFVLGSFATLALVLALVGIYGVVAFSVAQRTQEFGIRMALGADAARVLREVIGQATRVTGIGIAAGVVVALVMSRMLASLLFEVDATDPATYVAIATLLLAVTVLASWVPARRATRVTPVAALRND